MGHVASTPDGSNIEIPFSCAVSAAIQYSQIVNAKVTANV